MNPRLALSIAIFALMAVLQTAKAGPERNVPQSDTARETCSHSGESSVMFSSKDAPDTMHVAIDGDPCVDPIVSIEIHNAAGNIVYSTQWPALSASYDCGPVADCVEWVFDNALGNYWQWQTDTLQPLAQVRENDLYYIRNEAAYEYAYKTDSPLYCYQSGKSVMDCLVYMDGESVLIFSYGT